MSNTIAKKHHKEFDVQVLYIRVAVIKKKKGQSKFLKSYYEEMSQLKLPQPLFQKSAETCYLLMQLLLFQKQLS